MNRTSIVMLVLVLATSAAAQDSPGIRVDAVSPVYVIDRAQIEASGVAILGDLLQEIPMVAGGLNPQFNNGGADGKSTINLRALGAGRTMILLNGRRFHATGTQAQDVNTIPINLVERIEVQLDSASVLYGSDAVSGVVNIITRRDSPSLEAVTSFGQSSAGDGARTYTFLTHGSETESSRLFAGLNFDRRNAVSAGDRSYSTSDLGLLFGEEVPGGSSATPDGQFAVTRASAAAAGIACPGSGRTVTLTRVAGASGSSFDSANWRCANRSPGVGTDLYNFQPDNLVMTPQQRYGGFVLGSLDLSRNVELFAESLFHHTDAETQLAPEPLFGASEGVVISADNIFNPFHQNIFDSRVRMEALGPRRFTFSLNRFSATGGVRGRVSNRYDWEAYATVSETRDDSESRGLVFLEGLQAALGPSFRDANGVARCGTPQAPLPNCTPINYFALPGDAQATALLRELTPTARGRESSSLRVYSAHVTGPLGRLPAGAPAFAIGVERREESNVFRPDLLMRTGQLSGNPADASEGEIAVNEAYGEVMVPVLKDLPAVRRLDVSAGGRYSHHSSAGGTTVGKFGLNWRPVDGLSLRGSYGEVFHEPAIGQLFAPPFTFGAFYFDPCEQETTQVGANPNIDRACAGIPRDGSFSQSGFFTSAIIGANPNLKAETGSTITWSASYKPSFYAPLTMELAVWNIDLDGGISGTGAQERLNQCYLNGRFCDSFTRDPVTRQVIEIDDRLSNISRLERRGIDFGFRLQSLNTPIGPITYLVNATYLIRSDEEIIAGDPETLFENVGKFIDDTFPRWRALSSLQWANGPWQATIRTQYIDDVEEDPLDSGVNVFAGDCAPGVKVESSGAVCVRNIGSYFRSNVAATYSVTRKLDLTAGVDNLFDREPPRIYSAFQNNSDVAIYDMVGRSFWARVKVKL